MSDPIIAAEFLKTLVLLLTAFLIYVGPFRYARIALFRQHVFEIRNRLWDDLAECNALPIREHRRVRSMLNGLINKAHTIDAVLLARMAFALRGAKVESPISNAIREIRNEAARDALTRAMNRMAIVVIRQISLVTFPGILVGLPIYAIYKTKAYRIVPWCARKAASAKRFLFRSVDEIVTFNASPEVISKYVTV
jgi:hypothetical protein